MNGRVGFTRVEKARTDGGGGRGAQARYLLAIFRRGQQQSFHGYRKNIKTDPLSLDQKPSQPTLRLPQDPQLLQLQRSPLPLLHQKRQLPRKLRKRSQPPRDRKLGGVIILPQVLHQEVLRELLGVPYGQGLVFLLLGAQR